MLHNNYYYLVKYTVNHIAGSCAAFCTCYSMSVVVHPICDVTTVVGTFPSVVEIVVNI